MTITGKRIKRWQAVELMTQRMLADEDLTGDLLAFALVVLHMDNTGPGKNWCDRARIALGWEWWKVRHIASRDAPHYLPTDRSTEGCIAPMIRRDGTCGKRGTTTFSQFVDPRTGERELVTVCSRHNPPRRHRHPSFDAWEANGEPTPPANTGGVLARYFTGPAIAGLYEWARPDYDREGKGMPRTTRPTLRLIRGEVTP